MDLCDRREIQALLERHGFHFSKAMGQNFLIESWVPRDIADSCGAGEEKVKSSLFRTRQRLRAVLEKEGML